MKYLFKISVIITLLFLQCSPFSKDKNQILISVMSDITDPDIPTPTVEELKTFLENQEGDKQVRFQSITHTGHNPIFEFSLPASSNWGNPLEEKNKKERFYLSLEEFLQKQINDSIEYKNSSIIVPLLRELEYLSDQPHPKKVILLYSNLFEAHPNTLNIYSMKGQQELFNSTQQLLERWQKGFTIPYMEVDLYVVYYPNSLLDTKRFDTLYKVYQSLLEPKGIHLHRGIPMLMDTL